jgi:8-oxo-dGTP pyrophosphatase MutT (NUDIX family)
VIVFRDDEVLLVQRVRNGGDWVLPGGCPRPGEGMAACARREVLEETGLRVDVTRVAFALEAIGPNGNERTIEIVFLAAPVPFTADVAATEPGLAPAFVAVDGLAGLDLRPPIAGHLRGMYGRVPPPTAPYLGNLWRPHPTRAE